MNVNHIHNITHRTTAKIIQIYWCIVYSHYIYSHILRLLEPNHILSTANVDSVIFNDFTKLSMVILIITSQWTAIRLMFEKTNDQSWKFAENYCRKRINCGGYRLCSLLANWVMVFMEMVLIPCGYHLLFLLIQLLVDSILNYGIC